MSNQSPQQPQEVSPDRSSRLNICGFLALGWIFVTQISMRYGIPDIFLWCVFALMMPWILGLKPAEWPTRISFPLMTLAMTCIIFGKDTTFYLFHLEVYFPFFFLSLMGITLLMLGPAIPGSIQLLGILLQCASFGYIALGQVAPVCMIKGYVAFAKVAALPWNEYGVTLGIIVALCCFISATVENLTPKLG